MTLRSELASWKSKKVEAERELAFAGDDARLKTKFGSASRVAGENINRIESVLAERPWTDEIEAEDQRHFKARESIFARYKK